MKLSRLRPDPLRFVVGVPVLAVLLAVPGGLFSAPAVHWAVNRGELSERIVVGYGSLTAIRLFNAGDERDETGDDEQSGLGLLGQLLLVVCLYSGALAFAVVVVSTVGGVAWYLAYGRSRTERTDAVQVLANR